MDFVPAPALQGSDIQQIVERAALCVAAVFTQRPQDEQRDFEGAAIQGCKDIFFRFINNLFSKPSRSSRSLGFFSIQR